MIRDDIDDYALDGMCRSVGSAVLGDLLYELAEDICEGKRPLDDVVFGLAVTTDDDLIGVDPFDGDFDSDSALSDRMVTARKDYECHLTGRLISKGARHRCRTARYEGRLQTWRFSIAALWLASQGADPTLLRSEATALLAA